uniref:Aquaporin-3 n=1 Tax=Phasianus colchicus TaxID=9054 RepID=A0A669R2J0_PHACC
MGYVSFVKRTRVLLCIQNQLARECLAELLAVFMLILITLGGAAQMVTSSGTKGNIITSSLAGALAVMVAIYTAGGVSGAHLNPAFSLSMSLLGQLPWWKFPIFVAVQTFGSFIAAATVYALYYDAIWSYSNGTLTTSGPRETASIFATYPAEHLSLPNGFLDQVLGTAVLIVGILAITDTRNRAVPRGLEPLAVALLVLAIEVSMGSNCGSPMNPARDFGPRLFTLAAGWGTEVFRWVLGVGPGGGAAFGCSTPTAPLAAGAARGGGCRWWPRWWGPRWALGSISSSWPSTTPRRKRRTAGEHAGRPSTDSPECWG